MARRAPIEFLERSSYRQRRARDGARMMPLFAAVLMMLPLMWPRETDQQSLTSNGMYYIFGLWVVLVVVAFLLSRVLRFDAPEDEPTIGQEVAKGQGPSKGADE